MNNSDSGLVFSVLFKSILSYWPKFIDVEKLRLDKDYPNLYTVNGLGNIGDSIAEKFNSETDAVLMITICDAITSTVRSAALFSTVINPALLRPSTVRENFERRLHRAAINSELGWSEDDILLIKRYFEVNMQ